MELGNVFSKFSSKEKVQERFFAVEISSESVSTAVWQVSDGKTKVVSIGTTEEWESTNKPETLHTAIDTSLAKTMEEIETEPNKVMFGLQEGWVDGDTISRDYTKLLKDICEKFEFEPIGFVVTTEAIIQLLKKQEGTPTTAIVIRVNETELIVNVVSIGKITGVETVARSEDIGADVEEGLARFKVDEHLPSRIMLFNGSEDLEKLKQDLLSYNWLEKLPFLHFPKVEILDRQIAIKSVSIAGGEEAAKALGFEIIEEEQEQRDTLEQVEKTKQQAQPDQINAEQQEEKKPTTEEGESLVIADAEEIGFTTHTDSSTASGEERLEKQLPAIKPTEKKQVDRPSKVPVLEDEDQDDESDQYEEEGSENRFNLVSSITALFSPMKNLMKTPSFLTSGIAGRMNSRVKVMIIGVVGVIILLFAGLVFAYWTLPKAKVELYVKPKTLEKEITITISSSVNSVNLDENIIPGKIVETEIEGSREKQTSGTKTIGEKATGEVALYNKTSSEKTFPSGTVLIGSNGLRFVLDGSVTIASASAVEADDSLTTTFGKAKVNVSAEDIGSEYNLDGGSEFSVDSFSSSSYDSKSETPLVGGSSREVQAISQEDLDTLIDELTTELKAQAAQELEKTEGSGKQVLSNGARVEVLSQTTSGEVSEEAELVSLSMRLSVTSQVYEEADFEELIRQAVDESIPENFTLAKEESTAEIRSIDFEGEDAEIYFIYKAALIPVIYEEEIKRNLAGRYPSVAQEYLESLPNFSKATIEISPKALPARLKTFPRKMENISIEVKVEK